MHEHCNHHDHQGHEGHGHTEAEGGRRGARLEDGAAHTQDHLKWSRRDFLTRLGMGVAGASVMLNGSPVTAFGHAPILQAIQSADVDRILVLIQLNGGNDALNTVVPYEIDEYYRVRPTIAIPRSQVLPLENDHGLHPAMASLTNLWNNNRLAAVLNTGYRSSTRSHFEGTVNWATGSGSIIGSGNVNYTSGVWGRYVEDVLDTIGQPLDHPLAVLIGGPVSLFQSNLGNLGVSLGDAQFIEEIARRGLYDATDARVDNVAYGRPLKYARAVANAALSYVSSIQRAANAGTNLAGTYPNGFGDNMSAAARLIRGGLGAKVISVSIGGFDTHSNQGGATGQYADRWRSIADSVAAFYQDLAVDGLDQKVLTMTYSEFGRTLGENGSRGTDHGAGASMLMFGPGLKRGVYGSQSDLVTQLYGGDPEPTTDFRSVYASILQDWFGMPPADVDAMLGMAVPRMDIIGSKVQVSNEPTPVPAAFQLSQNYPNPFNPTTNIGYTLNQPSRVTLQVFDAQGRLVRTLVDAYQAAGTHQIDFEGGRMPSGTYFYTLKTPDGAQSRSMVFMK